MKSTNLFLSVIFAMASYQVSASTCKLPQNTADFEEAPGFQLLLTVDPLKNLSETTAAESSMMTEAASANNGKTYGLEEGVGIFLDVPSFYNAGNIQYFKLGNELYALAHYYPGENEAGVVLKIKTTSEKKMRTADYEVIANVSDGDVQCQ